MQSAPTIFPMDRETSMSHIYFYDVVYRIVDCKKKDVLYYHGFCLFQVAGSMNGIFNRLLMFLALSDNLYIICSISEGFRRTQRTNVYQAEPYHFLKDATISSWGGVAEGFISLVFNSIFCLKILRTHFDCPPLVFSHGRISII